MNDDYLFRDGYLSEYLRQREAKLRAEIDGFASDYVLKVSLDDLISHLVDKYHIETVVLLRDQTYIAESGDAKVDMSHDPRYGCGDGRRCLVPATFAEFAVPFTGDAIILRFQPSTFDHGPPRARVVAQELRLRYTRTDHDHKAMRVCFDSDIQNIAKNLAWGIDEVELYNKGLTEMIRRHAGLRKEKFLKDRGLVEALGFPIKSRSGATATYAAPLTRKKLPIQQPTVTSGPFKPEPRLEMEHYEHILTVISNMVRVMERSPQAFVRMGEEDLRTHILVQLNGHYEGQATGETFNYEGKTDILIRVEGRNIFIGECKIWKGADALTETIDQLLGYTAWLDTKTAIIVFNRNKDLSAVLKQIPDLVKKHSNFKREVASYKNETGFRFVLHHRDDKNRELTLTVLVFDVPS